MNRKEEKRLTLLQLAEMLKAKPVGDLDYWISGINTLEEASPEDASFLANPRYAQAMRESKAGIICISPHTPPIEGKNFLVSENPSQTFQAIVEALLLSDYPISGFPGIHSTAIIHPSVKLGKQIQVGPYAVIDQGAEIGDNTQIGAFVYIGPETKVGSFCTLHPHVVIREKCELGNRVILQPGAVIGSCGFGYVTDAKGIHTKLEQLGKVVIEDDVEIGANTTIDRARFKNTFIGKGTKIDNLVQIAHNVSLGQNNIIVSQTGIAGSSQTGKNVLLGGQVGVLGHVKIADYTMVATRGGVSKSLLKTAKYAGSPAVPIGEYNRQQVFLRNIEEQVKKLEILESKVKNLEEIVKKEK